MVGELPFGAAVALSLVVDEAPLECVSGVGAEGDAAGLVVEGEFPCGFDEVGELVFVFVGCELWAAALEDFGAEAFGAADVVECECAVEDVFMLGGSSVGLVGAVFEGGIGDFAFGLEDSCGGLDEEGESFVGLEVAGADESADGVGSGFEGELVGSVSHGFSQDQRRANRGAPS